MGWYRYRLSFNPFFYLKWYLLGAYVQRPRQSAKAQIGQKYLRSLIRAFAVLMSHLPILNFTKGKGRRLRLNRCEGGSVFTGKICPKTHSLMAQLICHHLQLSYRQKTIKVQSTNTPLVRSLKRPLLLNQPVSQLKCSIQNLICVNVMSSTCLSTHLQIKVWQGKGNPFHQSGHKPYAARTSSKTEFHVVRSDSWMCHFFSSTSKAFYQYLIL